MFSPKVVLFGRRGVAPMVGGMMLINEWNFHLPLPQAMVLLFARRFLCCWFRYRTLASGRAGATEYPNPRIYAFSG